MASFVIPPHYEVTFHRLFTKQYKKLPQRIAKRVDARISRLLQNPNDPQLRVHMLKGDMAPVLSLDVNHDYRVWFLINGSDKQVQFLRIGTHSELYS